jgi:hypothetical protein
VDIQPDNTHHQAGNPQNTARQHQPSVHDDPSVKQASGSLYLFPEEPSIGRACQLLLKSV